MMSKTALIILNYNNCQDTLNCIESVLKNNTANVRFIVVDNASRKEERENLEQRIGELFADEMLVLDASKEGWWKADDQQHCCVLIANKENSGYARGNNLGLKLAYVDSETEYVMILNNDILFVADIIPSLIKRLNDIKDCAIISPLLYKAGMEEIDVNCARKNVKVKELIGKNLLHYWRRFRGVSVETAYSERYLMKQSLPVGKNTLEIELPSGSCMLLRKDVFEKIGSFDPYTFLYYEENIILKKLQKLHLKNYICVDLPCIHLGAATTSFMPSSYFIAKSNIDSERYYVKNYSGASLFMRSMHHLSTLFFLASFKLQKALTRKK